MLLNNAISPKTIKKMTFDERRRLCNEIRIFLISTISKTGGHLSSSLGAVELIVALHTVFDSPEDKFVFDVGHQAYTHKLITGRYDKFGSLRSEGGISGFPRPSESQHDAFIGGHSSVSISAALGIADAMKLKGDNHNVIAVIGDGALTGGEAYEGLNNAGRSKSNLIIVLNDNEMSISKNQGALAMYLSGITSTKKYYETKHKVKGFLNGSNLGKTVSKSVSDTKKLVKYAIFKSNLFEDLGFKYIGPVDGHNLEELTEAFDLAKMVDKPCIVHVKTKKGKGYRPAEENSGEYHGVAKASLKNNDSITYSEVFGRHIVNLGKTNPNICTVTAAMKYATGLHYFHKAFPDRFFDVGIAEEHALSFCCGLASQGMVPVFAVYSTFLQRCYDQIIHDAAIENTHIVLAVDRAGVVGEDGETHQGVFDAAMLSAIPHTEIYSPSNANELKKCIELAVNKRKGIVAVRYPRGNENIHDTDDTTNYKFYYYGGKALVITYGRITGYAKRVCPDYKADLLKLVKIYPFSYDILEIISNYDKVFIFEEGILQGGIAEKIMNKAYQTGFKGKFIVRGIDRKFVKAAEYEQQLADYYLDANGMIMTLSGALSEEN